MACLGVLASLVFNTLVRYFADNSHIFRPHSYGVCSVSSYNELYDYPATDLVACLTSAHRILPFTHILIDT